LITVREFQVQPEWRFGRHSDGPPARVINVVTKIGNQTDFQEAPSEYFRDESLNARSPKPGCGEIVHGPSPDINQFGPELSAAPIKKKPKPFSVGAS